MFKRGWPIIVGILISPSLALAQQTDYSAGKTPAQLFTGDCSACHKTPRGLAKGRDQRALSGFLREHYTTKAESAGALANYLLSNPGPAVDPRNAAEARKRKPGEIPDGPARAARGEPAGENTDIAVPEGGQRPGVKPADPRASRRAKKPDPAEVAREAAKAAEEALKAKVNAYATMGDAARPIVTEAAAPPSEAPPPAPAAETAVPAPETPASPPPVQNSATEPAPAAETHAPAEEHPAATPPG